MIICLEGIDACGKATQAAKLATKIRGKVFSFPNDHAVTGPHIRANLRGDWSAIDRLTGGASTEAKWVNALVRQSLMLTNRLELMAEVTAAHKDGPIVLNRFAASAMVYGTLDGLDREWLERVNAPLPIQPDVYVLIDVPVEESFKRRPERQDQYESNYGFLEKVRTGYLRLFCEMEERRLARRNDPGRSAPRLNVGPIWRTIDGRRSVEAVHEEILRACSI